MHSTTYIFIAVVVLVVANILTRWLPFLLEKSRPVIKRYLHRLGAVLPPGMIVLLVIYSLKDLGAVGGIEVVPAALALVILWVMHQVVKKPLPGMVVSTFVYVLLLNMGGV